MYTIEAQVIDETHLQLSKPISSPPGRRILVIIPQEDDIANERNSWLQISQHRLAQCSSKDEPDYSFNLLQ